VQESIIYAKETYQSSCTSLLYKILERMSRHPYAITPENGQVEQKQSGCA